MYRSYIKEVYVHTRHVLVRFLVAWFVARRWYRRCRVDRRESHGADLEVLGMLCIEPMPLVEHDVFRLCKAEKLGESMRSSLKQIQNPLLLEVRGKGLLNAIVIDETKSTKGRSAWDLCLLLKDKGLLAKPTHQNIIRLAPPLVISEEEMERGIKIITEALDDLDKVDTIPGAEAH